MSGAIVDVGKYDFKGQGFFVCIEPSESIQSVFPEDLSEYSQGHTDIEDAVEYICEVVGHVRITVETRADDGKNVQVFAYF